MARELSSEGLVILSQSSTQLPGGEFRVSGGHLSQTRVRLFVVNDEKHDAKFKALLL